MKALLIAVVIVIAAGILYYFYAQDTATETETATETLCQQARQLYRAGEYAPALAAAKEALANAEEKLGPDDPGLGPYLICLADIYYNPIPCSPTAKVCPIPERDKAEPLYQRALTLTEKAHGPDAPAVARVLHKLARAQVGQYHYPQAVSLAQRALAIFEKTPDANLSDRAETLKLPRMAL